MCSLRTYAMKQLSAKANTLREAFTLLGNYNFNIDPKQMIDTNFNYINV